MKEMGYGRSGQYQAVLLVKQQNAVRQPGKQLIKVFLQGNEGCLFASHLLSQQIQFGREHAPFVCAVELNRFRVFAARHAIDALRNSLQRPQQLKREKSCGKRRQTDNQG